MQTNTSKFSDRAEDYLKNRRRLSNNIIEILKNNIGVDYGLTIANIGSGTGISSEPFLKMETRFSQLSQIKK